MAAMQRGNAPADTTYTKIFVGGLAWETQRDTMRRYFEQFGEIVEAVVITDKNTGRSKGYGFVTFKDPESAMQACENPTPVIDGRRANCNLAFLGANNNNNNNNSNRLRPPIPQIEMGRIRPMISSAYHGPAASTMAAAYYHHQPPNYALPYSYYGYSSSYSQENVYPMNYYGVGGQQQQQQFAPYYPLTTPTGVYANYQPYYSSSYAQSTHNLQYYHQMLQYSPYLPQQFASSSAPVLPLPTSVPAPIPGSSIASSSTRPPVKITSNQNKTS